MDRYYFFLLQKSTEKILTSLIPLNEYDGLNNDNLAPSDFTDHQSTDSGFSGVYVGGHQKHDDDSSQEVVSLSSSSPFDVTVSAYKDIQEICKISPIQSSSKIDSGLEGEKIESIPYCDNQTSDTMSCTLLVNYDFRVDRLPADQSKTYREAPVKENLESEAKQLNGDLTGFSTLQLDDQNSSMETHHVESESVSVLDGKSHSKCPRRRQTAKLSGGRGRKRKTLDNIDDLLYSSTSAPSTGQNSVHCTDDISGKVATISKIKGERKRAPENDKLNLDMWTIEDCCDETITQPSSPSLQVLRVENCNAVSCRMCQVEFLSFQLFEEHFCKDGKKFMICETCDRRFSRPRLFRKHLMNHTLNDCGTNGSPSVAECKTSKMRTKAENGMRKSKRYYDCSHCEKKFLQRSSLHTHLREHADGKIVCTKCGIMCEDESEYEHHVVKHAEEASSYCEKCDESFVRRQQYDQHLAGHEKYDCIPCQKNFSTKKQMLKHQRIIHGIRTPEERRHECQICHKKFQRPTLLESHTRVHTGEKPIQCGHCDKSFRTSKSLTKHLKTSTHMKACGEFEEKALEATKPFLCAQCGAKFFRKQGLLRHMQQLHSDERPYECEFCEYKCKCKTNLKRHIELHKDERRFICELCGASFHAHATLKEHHAYVHSDVRGFVCPNCGKGFKGRSGLRRHIRSHSDARPFICFCGQSYKRMSHLKRHMASIHSVSFKSKRVQRIITSEGFFPSCGGGGGDDSNSFLMAMDPSSEVEGTVPFTDITSSKEVPIINANELLIIDGSKSAETSSLMAQTLTLEVATQTIGQNILTHMHIPNQLPNAQAMITSSQPLPIEIPSLTDKSVVADQSLIPTVAPLPSISDTAELRRALAFASIALPLSTSNIALSIPAEVSQPPPPPFSSVPSKDQSVAYQGVPNVLSSVPLQPLNPDSKILAAPESTLIPMTTEFYTQGPAQYITM